MSNFPVLTGCSSRISPITAHHKDFTHFIDLYYFIATAIDFILASNILPPLC
jgi:hypothetical protein